MVMDRRAQFFLLAAVIISAIVISLGVVSNRATVNREPESFYDFSYEVKREVGAVIDYHIYSDVEGGPLTDFIGLLSEDIKDRDPDANFLFLYGDNETMYLRNEGTESAYVDDNEYRGAGAIVVSTLCRRGSCKSIRGETGDFDEDTGEGTLDIKGASEVIVTIGDYDYSFPISEYRQVIFIIQKEIKDENFIGIE